MATTMGRTTIAEKILAKAAELEQQAAALRIAAAFLGNDATAGKVESVARRISEATAVRRAQTNGHGAPHEAPAPAKKKRRYLSTEARAEKREQLFQIIRDYGKPMPIAVLKEAARERGIASLTGMYGYVRAGLLKQAGRKGKTRYSLPPA